jgi:hypothetical protein
MLWAGCTNPAGDSAILTIQDRILAHENRFETSKEVELKLQKLCGGFIAA